MTWGLHGHLGVCFEYIGTVFCVCVCVCNYIHVSVFLFHLQARYLGMTSFSCTDLNYKVSLEIWLIFYICKLKSLWSKYIFTSHSIMPSTACVHATTLLNCQSQNHFGQVWSWKYASCGFPSQAACRHTTQLTQFVVSLSTHTHTLFTGAQQRLWQWVTRPRQNRAPARCVCHVIWISKSLVRLKDNLLKGN